MPPQDLRTMDGLAPDAKVQVFVRYDDGNAANVRMSAKEVTPAMEAPNVQEARLMSAEATSEAPWPDETRYIDGVRGAQKYFDGSPDVVRDVEVTYKSTLKAHARVNRDGMLKLLEDPNIDKVGFDNDYNTWNLPDTEAVPPEQRGQDYAPEVRRLAIEARKAREAAQAREEQGYRDAYDGPEVALKDPPAGLFDANREWPSVQSQLDKDGTVTLYRGMRVPRGHAILDGGGVDSKDSFGGQYSTADPRQALSYGARPEGDHPGGFQADDDAVLVSFRASKWDLDVTSDPRVAVLRPNHPLTQQPGYHEVARVPADKVFQILPPKASNLSPAMAPKLNPPKAPQAGCPTCGDP
jgi:hypothetical protein